AELPEAKEQARLAPVEVRILWLERQCPVEVGERIGMPLQGGQIVGCIDVGIPVAGLKRNGLGEVSMRLLETAELHEHYASIVESLGRGTGVRRQHPVEALQRIGGPLQMHQHHPTLEMRIEVFGRE